MQNEIPRQIEVAIAYLKDSQKFQRKLKYFLNSKEAKKRGITTKEELNTCLRTAEAILSKEWGKILTKTN